MLWFTDKNLLYVSDSLKELTHNHILLIFTGLYDLLTKQKKDSYESFTRESDLTVHAISRIVLPESVLEWYSVHISGRMHVQEWKECYENYLFWM